LCEKKKIEVGFRGGFFFVSLFLRQKKKEKMMVNHFPNTCGVSGLFRVMLANVTVP
jgi:hypothetical protein